MKKNKLFRLIKECVSDSDIDFTAGSIRKAIFLPAIPMILEMIMESIFVVADIWFVSRLGTDAFTAVGITGYSNLFFMFVINIILILIPESFIKLFIDDPRIC